MKRYFILMMFLISIMAGVPAGAQDKLSALVVSSSPELVQETKTVLNRFFSVNGGLEPDYANATVRTVENKVLAITGFFETKDIGDSAALKDLCGQYKADILVALWVREDKGKVNEVWGLGLSKVTVYAAFFDMASGRLLHSVKESRDSSASGTEGLIKDALKVLVSRSLSDACLVAENKLKRLPKQAARVLLKVDGLDEKAYFADKDLILKSVKDIDGVLMAQESYALAEHAMTIRVDYGKTPQDFYLALYKKISGESRYKTYALNVPDGYMVNMTRLDLKSGRTISVIFNNISSDFYNKNGALIFRLLKGLDGVVVSGQNYDEAQSRLSYSVQTGQTLLNFDRTLWKKLSAESGLSTIIGDKLGDGAISYVCLGTKVTGTLYEVTVLNMSAENYTAAGKEIIAILESVPGVKDMRFSYDQGKSALVMTFGCGDSSVRVINDTILAKVKNNDILKNLALSGMGQRSLIYSCAAQVSEGKAQNLADIIEKTQESVVTIYVCAGEVIGHGSGFFVNKDGYIITNHHVVKGGGEFVVRTYSGERCEAEVVTYDAVMDLALLKLKDPCSSCPAVTLGSSDGLRKGQNVIIMGTPLSSELENSVTTGIISGLNRSEGEAHGLIQVSAPIFPGNSGGPVFDDNGKVIGIAKAVAISTDIMVLQDQKSGRQSAVAIPSRESNIGLVIPVNSAGKVLESIEH